MNKIELELYLKKTYDVLCCIDLADISQSPDRVYQVLNQHYKPVFDSNQRIVFYSQFCPDPALIKHIVRAALLIDISNSFILICSAADISKVISDACSDVGIVDDALQFQQIDIKSAPLKENYMLPDTICPLPWRNLEVRSNGSVATCCINTLRLGHIEQGLENLLVGDALSGLRQEFLQGKRPNSCNACWHNEHQGLISNRVWHNNLLLKNLLVQGLDTPHVQSLDLKLGLTCNFKCRICGPGSSSAHVQEQAKFKNIPFVMPNNWAEDPVNIEQIMNLLPTLTNIDMYGGEPFLLKSFSAVLELAVKQGHAKNIRLHYNTNGSVYPTHLIEYWKYFQYIDIQFSIDNIGKRFELERGGSWTDVEENILKIKDLKLPNCELNIMPAISVMNIFYIDEVVGWAKKHQFGIHPLYVANPDGYSLGQLTKQAKELIVKKYQHHPWDEIQNILKAIESTPDSDGAKFIKITKHYDSIRNENFSNSHPEIALAMGYSV